MPQAQVRQPILGSTVVAKGDGDERAARPFAVDFVSAEPGRQVLAELGFAKPQQHLENVRHQGEQRDDRHRLIRRERWTALAIACNPQRPLRPAKEGPVAAWPT